MLRFGAMKRQNNDKMTDSSRVEVVCEAWGGLCRCVSPWLTGSLLSREILQEIQRLRLEHEQASQPTPEKAQQNPTLLAELRLLRYKTNPPPPSPPSADCSTDEDGNQMMSPHKQFRWSSMNSESMYVVPESNLGRCMDYGTSCRAAQASCSLGELFPYYPGSTWE